MNIQKMMKQAQEAQAKIADMQGKLEEMVRTAKSAAVGRHPLSDFVNADPKALKFDAIENAIEQAVASVSKSRQVAWFEVISTRGRVADDLDVVAVGVLPVGNTTGVFR